MARSQNIVNLRQGGTRTVSRPHPVPIPKPEPRPIVSLVKENNNPWRVRSDSRYPQSTVFVLGGGPSLEDFDFCSLADKFVIGCNDAYRLGSGIVDVCFFGDGSWWRVHHERILKDYEGTIVSNQGAGKKAMSQGVKWMRKKSAGLSDKDGILGWNSNSGAAAFNLALLFGASTVVLLGFDMELGGSGSKRSNWHPNEVSCPKAGCYTRYLKGFDTIYVDFLKMFPDVRVINANPNSVMSIFPKMDREEAMQCKS